MPAAKPPEFRRRAVDLACAGDQPVAKIASDLGISESCLRRRMAVDDVDAGRKEGSLAPNAPSWSNCVAGPGCRRWRSRSSSAPRPTSPGRTCCWTQNADPAGPRAGRRQDPCRGDLQGAWHLPLRVL